MKNILCMVLAALYLLTSCQKETVTPTPEDPAPIIDTQAYTEISYNDFTIKMKSYLIDTPDAKSALELMKKNLDTINKIIPEAALKVMHKNPIWVEKDIQKDGAAWYHTSIDWLRQNGYNTEKAKCVEINNYVNYVSWCNQNQPYMVLHELCHLYHDLVYTYDDPDILAAYNNAVSTKLYLKTDYFDGYRTYQIDRAYALTNQMEYFSEICEAYWGKNDYYPFDYYDLKTYDTLGFALMEKVWGVRESK